MNFVRSKKFLVVLIALIGLSAIPLLYSLTILGPSIAVFGPVNCDACKGQRPEPDVATKAFLLKYMQITNRERKGTHLEPIQTGAKVIVCNGSHCTTYQMTDSNDWNGTTQEAITQSPRSGVGSGSGQGSGQGVGRGGGADVGGGSYGGGGRTGTVTVGPGGPIPKLPKGSQEI
ncbi:MULTISPECIES: hypothetical protein [Stenotrophomonas]|uniref:hypothetical protein n=1 Tax=Stenotrophomonas TaxID=40323 RepID=UPI0025547A97|nr:MULTISPECIES: hypothetical protein [Stenotrophomonas]EKU9958665.1 hypothetical protein [Stenotrophomonas maltophilia]EKU9961636.1 hypothetical protein [Stenotrophomonas maltophilia]EKU9986458.1 hypothetical protein [Stenotrophomonas maltophilia]EKU9988088.1 hypothetical protein [Stenotrophomonas maltophilia]